MTAEEKRIAIVGASRNRAKFGNKCVRAYQRAGWMVFPVNPRAEVVEDLEAYPTLDAIPDHVDRISLYTPPPRTRRLLPSLPIGVEIFFNPGTADTGILEEARALGLEVHNACAIVALGFSPSQFGDQVTE